MLGLAVERPSRVEPQPERHDEGCGHEDRAEERGTTEGHHRVRPILIALTLERDDEHGDHAREREERGDGTEQADHAEGQAHGRHQDDRDQNGDDGSFERVGPGAAPGRDRRQCHRPDEHPDVEQSGPGQNRPPRAPAVGIGAA